MKIEIEYAVYLIFIALDQGSAPQLSLEAALKDQNDLEAAPQILLKFDVFLHISISCKSPIITIRAWIDCKDICIQSTVLGYKITI